MRCPFHSFDEFWPYYLSEHARKETRVLHLVGTAAAIAFAALTVILAARVPDTGVSDRIRSCLDGPFYL